MAEKHAGIDSDDYAYNDNRARKETPPVNSPVPNKQKNPGFQQRWRNVQFTKSNIFWIVGGAIVLTLILGFTLGGWVTGGASLKAANTSAQAAVVMRLAPICVAQFNQDPQRDEKLVELQSESSYKRASYITTQGWATMPGEDTADNKVAMACAKLLMDQ